MAGNTENAMNLRNPVDWETFRGYGQSVHFLLWSLTVHSLSTYGARAEVSNIDDHGKEYILLHFPVLHARIQPKVWEPTLSLYRVQCLL